MQKTKSEYQLCLIQLELECFISSVDSLKYLETIHRKEMKYFAFKKLKHQLQVAFIYFASL